MCSNIKEITFVDFPRLINASMRLQEHCVITYELGKAAQQLGLIYNWWDITKEVTTALAKFPPAEYYYHFTVPVHVAIELTLFIPVRKFLSTRVNDVQVSKILTVIDYNSKEVRE